VRKKKEKTSPGEKNLKKKNGVMRQMSSRTRERVSRKKHPPAKSPPTNERKKEPSKTVFPLLPREAQHQGGF